MSCSTAGTQYNINGVQYTVPGTPSDDNQEVCRATKILETLHAEFTDKYTITNLVSNNLKPSFYLRNQPTSSSNGSDTNRFLNNLTNVPNYNGDPYYRTMISVIMKGREDTDQMSFNQSDSSITALSNFSDSTKNNFKGIYGLNKLIEILEGKINALLTVIPSTASSSSSPEGVISRFRKRADIKNTLEEVAYRENEIYREKFLNIILIIVGIFLVGSQLANKFFSGGDSGGSGGAGLGGLFGYGFGGSGGLFSRFGGLGLGSSGRSHFDIGNLFKKSSYTLAQR